MSEEPVAVIMGGGMGRRLHPLTRSIAKSLVAVGDRPCIQHILDELRAARIYKIIVIINRGDRALRGYFQVDSNVKMMLAPHGRFEEPIQLETSLAEFDVVLVEQPEPLGAGNALLLAEEYIDSRTALIILPDDLIWPVNTGSQALLTAGQRFAGHSVLQVREVIPQEVSAFGTISASPILGEDAFWQIHRIAEKASYAEAPSTLGLVGRYLLTPQIFDALRMTKTSQDGELRLADAINIMLSRGQQVIAQQTSGRHFDIGTPDDLMKASLYWILRHGPQWAAKYAKEIIS